MKEGLAMKTVGEIMPEVPSFLNLFLGKMMGSSGEVAAFALLIGMLYLLYQERSSPGTFPYPSWATVFIFTGILWLVNPDRFADPAFPPAYRGTHAGSHLYGHRLCHFSHDRQRNAHLWSGNRDCHCTDQDISEPIPEGVQFAILIFNGFTPLLNKYIKPKRFGKEVAHG